MKLPIKLQGLALIALTLLLPLIWLPGLAGPGEQGALFSQYIGLVALYAMAIAFVIATRWPGVEAIFGPMDQSYRVHKWLGIGAMVALLIHDTIDADMRSLGRPNGLNDLAETMGEISLYGLIILVVITIATFIPYHLWKWTHRLIGIPFLLGAAHTIFILKPFANTDPLGLYTLAICLIGAVAYAYTSAPRALRPKRDYEITEVTHEGDALAVTMTPKGKPMHQRAGQFAFFGFTGAGMGEPHPFTISSGPKEDGSLRVSIAPLGDLTIKYRAALATGQSVTVEGPFGHFGGTRAKDQVWIGAGIGITPFLALAEALKEEGPNVTLVFACKTAEKAPHFAQLRKLAKEKPNLTLIVWESTTKGRFTIPALAETLGSGLIGKTFLFCGPTPMRKSLGEALKAQGIPRSKFHYEAFEIRTGLGIRNLVALVQGKAKPQTPRAVPGE